SLANVLHEKGDDEGTLAALADYKTHGGKLDEMWYLLQLVCLEKLRQSDRLLEVLKEAYAKYPANESIKTWYEKYFTAMRANEKDAAMTEGGTLHFAIRFQTPDDQ